MSGETLSPKDPRNLRELDFRKNDGMHIWLVYDAEAEETAVLVDDRKADDRFEVPVRGENPLEVFHHPNSFPDSRIRRPGRAALLGALEEVAA